MLKDIVKSQDNIISSWSFSPMKENIDPMSYFVWLTIALVAIIIFMG